MLSQKDLFKSAVLNAVNQFKIENKIYNEFGSEELFNSYVRENLSEYLE